MLKSIPEGAKGASKGSGLSLRDLAGLNEGAKGAMRREKSVGAQNKETERVIRVDYAENGPDFQYIRFGKITKGAHGTGLCYIRDAKERRTKANKPFVTFYVVDVEDVTIPAYMFDVGSMSSYGKDLFSSVGSVVQIEWDENYLNTVGMTIIIRRIGLIDPSEITPDVLKMFLGRTEDVETMFNYIVEHIRTLTGHKFVLPVKIQTLKSIDFDKGRVGGLVPAYYRTLKVLESMGDLWDKDMEKKLFNTFTLYIIAHSSYIDALEKGEADISLLSRLNSEFSKSIDRMTVTKGAMEVVHVFFGVEPKDFYVRTVDTVFKMVNRIEKEKNILESLPELYEGNAGYGIIRKYSE